MDMAFTSAEESFVTTRETCGFHYDLYNRKKHCSSVSSGGRNESVSRDRKLFGLLWVTISMTLISEPGAIEKSFSNDIQQCN
jgi:hypothetical protein